MKQFLKDYGFAIISAIVIITLVAMSTPIGATIKSEVSNITNSFAALTENKFDHIDYDPDANPYTEKVLSVQTLYDVGEQNLTQDDIVNINGVNCYVLKLSSDKSKAKLITVDIYETLFDRYDYNNGKKTNVGTANIFCQNMTYDYSQAYLRKFMNDFYYNELNSDLRILPSDINYYIKDLSTPNFSTGTIKNEYVFALDAVEAEENANKFCWIPTSDKKQGFLTTKGHLDRGGASMAWHVLYDGSFGVGHTSTMYFSARPVFWLSLE